MQKHTGNVAYIGEKHFNGTTLYSFTLAGVDGFFLCGDRKPDAQKGQKISFFADGKKVDVDSIENHGYPEKSNNSGGSKKSSGSKNDREDYWQQKAEKDDQREIVMALENARYSALQTLQLAKDVEAISLPQKKGDRLPALDEMIEEYTQKYFRQNLYAEAPEESVVAPKEQKSVEELQDEMTLDDFNELEDL